MKENESSLQGDLARRPSGPLSSHTSIFSIGNLEHALLEEFPREDAELWDYMGLLVGDPSEVVHKVAIALDPTIAAIHEAHGAHAQVLITHHPAFINPPSVFSPYETKSGHAGALVWEAIKNDVALMNFHTALDVSVPAQKVLPSLLSLDYEGVLEPLAYDENKGYGQICHPRSQDDPLSLTHLAARCTSVFGRPPRVWGRMSDSLETIVCANGSASNLISSCLEKRVDCLVAGEVKYHDALALSEAGIAVIDLGHDTSELPLVMVIKAALIDIGLDEKQILTIDQTHNWIHPDATRV
ncbi:MAG: Nif3-like dinuclear metal center hexameric protein [Eggerthellaceae bacterium]|jgi:putative NIF3 family GTP cyclohydrolase 1 type 2